MARVFPEQLLWEGPCFRLTRVGKGVKILDYIHIQERHRRERGESVSRHRDPKVEKRITVEKGKQGAVQLLFGRTTVIMVSLLIQVGVLLLGATLLQRYLVYLYGFYLALTAVIVIVIINKEGNPDFKLAWMVPMLIIPVFGTILYLFVSMQAGSRNLNKKLTQIIRDTSKYVRQEDRVIAQLEAENPRVASLAKYMNEKAGYPIYRNSTVEYFPLGEDKFRRLVEELKKAERYIFMEYFIVAEGYMWDTVREILVKKAKEGVEVRFMYDGTCALTLLPYGYPAYLESLGIRCKMFGPIKPVLSTVQNNRDHRKIVVIDGHTAFTGGINLADEYINQKMRFGHWKDTAVMVKGEAVRNFTLMFLQMWGVDEKREDYYDYLAVPRLEEFARAPGYVLPYGDSPLDNENVGELVYMDMLNTANRYVHIMTPYLILDHDMITALTYTAKRGVEVIILMPHIPDKVYAFTLAKTYYPELLESGVQIYEYTPGFVHAKVFVSDDDKAVVGTINMDYRSMYLHFECGAYMYKVPEIARSEEDMQNCLEVSQRVTLEDFRRRSPWSRLAGGVLRLIAPLM